MEVEPALIKTAGQLFAGSISLRNTSRDGGEVTSDETSSTPDHLDLLRAMKLQPGRDGMKEKRTNFKDSTDKVNESQETLL